MVFAADFVCRIVKCSHQRSSSAETSETMRIPASSRPIRLLYTFIWIDAPVLLTRLASKEFPLFVFFFICKCGIGVRLVEAVDYDPGLVFRSRIQNMSTT